MARGLRTLAPCSQSSEGHFESSRLFLIRRMAVGVKKVDLVSLSQILGRKVAVDVKKQMGEDVKEVPAGKRKGQLGLGKF